MKFFRYVRNTVGLKYQKMLKYGDCIQPLHLVITICLNVLNVSAHFYRPLTTNVIWKQSYENKTHTFIFNNVTDYHSLSHLVINVWREERMSFRETNI